MTAYRRSRRAARGVTLLEMVVVVAILGILGGLAHSAFRGQVLRARRSEAVLGLMGIYRSQVTYKGTTDRFGDTFDEIGFQLHRGRRVDERTIQGPVYTFTVRANPYNGDPRGGFQAFATADLDPSDSVVDILMIENFVAETP